FARGNPEETRVEAVDLVKEARVASRHLARGIRVRIEIFVDRPTVGWYFPDSLTPLVQQRPECIGAIRAGKPATDSNNSDWLANSGFGSVETVLELCG